MATCVRNVPKNYHHGLRNAGTVRQKRSGVSWRTGSRTNVFIDDTQGNFTIAHKLDVKENPDIVPLSAVLQCKMDIEQDRKEETYIKDGKTVSYDPPVYKYEYQYRMKIQVRSPWFDDMDFRLHNFSIEQDDRAEIMEIESAGYEIMSALTGQPR